MKKIILLSDTHNKLDNRFFPHFEQADEIWHAGDIGNISIIEKLEEFAPIKAVWGNIDNQDTRLQFEKITKFMIKVLPKKADIVIKIDKNQRIKNLIYN